MLLFLSVSVGLLVFCFAAILLHALNRDRLRGEERLKRLKGEQALPLSREKLRAQRPPRIKISTVLVEQLASAGVPMRAEEFLLTWMVLSFVPPALSALLEAHPFVSILLTAAGLLLPPLYVRRSRHKRLLAFEGQLADAVTVISNCLKSGLTFQQGMQTVAEQMPEPISREFARVLREMQLGSTLERALNSMVRRVPSADLKLMITAILISQQVGGNLSAVLDNIVQTVSDRLKIKQEIHTLTSAGRISGMIIGMLPVIVAVALTLLNPAYMQQFFQKEQGRLMLLVAAVMEAIGYMLIRKIVSVKY